MSLILRTSKVFGSGGGIGCDGCRIKRLFSGVSTITRQNHYSCNGNHGSLVGRMFGNNNDDGFAFSAVKTTGRRTFLSPASKKMMMMTRKSHLSTTMAAEAAGYDNHYDVLIVGGGVVGCSLARLLNERVPTLSVALIEARQGPPSTLNNNENTTEKSPSKPPHPRSYALSPRSLQILGNETIKDLEKESKLGYYNSMQVWECNNPASLIFTDKDINKENYLGAVVEDSSIVQSLWCQLLRQQQEKNMKVYTNTTLDNIQLPTSSSSSTVSVETNNGERITTSLLVAADGSRSPIRDQLGTPMINYEYGKQALTFTVKLKNNRKRRAYQRFLGPEGVIALLPTYSSEYGIIVWSTTPEIAQEWKRSSNNDNINIDNELLVQKLQSIFQDGPQRLPPLFEAMQYGQEDQGMQQSIVNNFLHGCERVLDTVQYGASMIGQSGAMSHDHMYSAPPEIVDIASSRLTFDLSCKHVSTYNPGYRVALVGDSAHTVHPMAGQGLNIGLADVDALVTEIVNKNSVGMDIGSEFCLQPYDKNRRKQVSATLLGIHTLHELFNTQNASLKHAKSLGMNMVQHIKPLREQVVQAATYGVII